MSAEEKVLFQSSSSCSYIYYQLQDDQIDAFVSPFRFSLFRSLYKIKSAEIPSHIHTNHVMLEQSEITETYE